MSSANRLARLLNLVPYLLARPGIQVADAAADLGVTESQLRDDLQLLWVCGLPGYGPGDLIDMSLAGDTVTITYDAGIDRPLRLTPDEAVALIVALRMLVDTPGLAAFDAPKRALAKLETAAGESSDAADHVTVQAHAGRTAERLAEFREILERGRAARISYYSASRDTLTERVVDPIRLMAVPGRAYLEAYCRTAESSRLFRLDRIDAVTELPEPAQVHQVDAPADGLRLAADAPLITLRIGRQTRWMTEYYPTESVVPEVDGNWLVTLRATDLNWAKRLVLSLGPDARVVSPPELAEAITAEARAALTTYR